jgi:hypothetical protein
MTHDDVDDRILRDAARRLGTAAAGRLDVERVAAHVTRRLRESPPVRFGWLRIAAAVAVLVGGGLTARAVLERDTPGGPPSFVADDLTDLSAEELRELLAALDDTTALPALDADTDLTELDAQQLRAVLRTLEG